MMVERMALSLASDQIATRNELLVQEKNSPTRVRQIKEEPFV